MPIRKSTTAPVTPPAPRKATRATKAAADAGTKVEAAERKPSDNDLLVSTTYVPTGAYVVIAMDETIDQNVVLFAPATVESIGDSRVTVLDRNKTVAEAIRIIADKVDADLKTWPKSQADKDAAEEAAPAAVKAPVKKVAAANGANKRGGTGPQKTDDPDAPWGRLPDGTPKQKPGRRAQVPAVAVKAEPEPEATNGGGKSVAAARKSTRRPSVAKSA